jgi:hypothetical protein
LLTGTEATILRASFVSLITRIISGLLYVICLLITYLSKVRGFHSLACDLNPWQLLTLRLKADKCQADIINFPFRIGKEIAFVKWPFFSFECIYYSTEPIKKNLYSHKN